MKHWYLIALLALCGCGKELLEPDPVDRGQLPVFPYVAIGGSETAGFADGALHLEAQQRSYPAMIAQQLALVGGGSFAQPLTLDSGGYAIIDRALFARLDLASYTDCQGYTSLYPQRREVGSQTFPNYYAASQPGPYGNWGIPFLRAEGLTNTSLSVSNPYYHRMGSSALTPVDAVMARQPKLFTIWLGTQEMLDYAINQQTPPAAIQLYNYLLPLVDSLLQDTAAVGFIATVPDITMYPFFYAWPASGLLIADPSAPGGSRPIRSGERLMRSIPLDSIKCGGWGTTVPISAQYVLDEGEIAHIQSQTESYNVIIRDLAEEKGLNVVDLAGLYRKLEQGVMVNGLTITNQWLHGGFFSLDGQNPTPRGAALIANEFIRTMNATYGAAIPLVSVVEQPGVGWP